MNKKTQKKDVKVGFHKTLSGATRYIIKKGNKTERLDVYKARVPNGN